MALGTRVRIFKTKLFAKFSIRERIADSALFEAAERAARGLVDADLGGGLIKQRVARAGRGRSGGYRVLLAFRSGLRTVFLFGFAKNDRDNISMGELAALREIAAVWIEADDMEIDLAVADGTLKEMSDGA